SPPPISIHLKFKTSPIRLSFRPVYLDRCTFNAMEQQMSETTSPSTQRGLTDMEFAPKLPAFAGPEGIFYDFNYGCRVQVPVDGLRVRMTDLDTFNLVMDE